MKTIIINRNLLIFFRLGFVVGEYLRRFAVDRFLAEILPVIHLAHIVPARILKDLQVGQDILALGEVVKAEDIIFGSPCSK